MNKKILTITLGIISVATIFVAILLTIILTTTNQFISIWSGNVNGTFTMNINDKFKTKKMKSNSKYTEGANANFSNGKLQSIPSLEADENGQRFIWLNDVDSQFNTISKKKIFKISDLNWIYQDELNMQSFLLAEHHELNADMDKSSFLISSFMDENFLGLTDDDRIIFTKDNGNELQEYDGQVIIQDILSITDEQIYDDNSYNLNAMEVQKSFPERKSIDFIHANAFDINPKTNRLFISSRTLGTIIIVDIEDLDNPKLEMILSNPIIYNYMENDGTNNPIIKYDGSGKFNWSGYMTNENYSPHIKKEWQGKTLDYIVNGERYSSEKNYWDLSEEYLFMGQHYVRSLNNFIEKTNLVKDYNPEHEYISIFDNHSSQDNPYQFHFENGVVGANKYDLDNNGKWDKGAFSVYGGNEFIEENLSYFKIIDIDPSNMTAKLITNVEIPYSPYISNAQIFSVEDKYFLYSHSGASTENNLNSIDKIWSFSSIEQKNDPNKSMIDMKEIWSYKYDIASYRGEIYPNNNYTWYSVNNT